MRTCQWHSPWPDFPHAAVPGRSLPMKGFKQDTFNERLSAAASATAALQAKFRTRPALNSPEALHRQEALKAIAAAREARNAERWATRAAEAARLAAEEKARKAEEAARLAQEGAAA